MMKRKLLPAIAALLFILLLVLAVCGRRSTEIYEIISEHHGGNRQTEEPVLLPEVPTHDEEPTDNPQEIKPSNTQSFQVVALTSPCEGYNETSQTPRASISVDLAAQYLAELEELWTRDGGALWGIPLHEPMIIACQATRHAVANMPDEGGIFTQYNGVYVGFLPEGQLIGNTAVTFGGRNWGMVTWDVMEDFADDKLERLRIMSHEAFHATQEGLLPNVGGFGNAIEHMQAKEMRVNTHLEMNALFAALGSTGKERLAAIHDALSIRAARRHGSSMFLIGGENMFELSEGTALYTELRLNFSCMDEILAEICVRMNKHFGHSAAWLSFGYYAGAMYALLLDEFGVQWQENIRPHTDLANLLMRAAGIAELKPWDEIDLYIYGYEKITEAERAWADRLERMEKNVEIFFAPDRAFLEIPFDFTIPMDVFHTADQLFLPSGFLLSGSFVIECIFGKLTITDGYLLRVFHASRAHRVCAAEIEINGNRIVGSYWELILNEGFELIPVG